MDNACKPLGGINVLTLAYNVPGPVAAQRLATLGASVTKIEPPDGEPFSEWCPTWYHELCVGQNIVRLDLKSNTGQEEMEHLLRQADLLITSIRPSALKSLSLDWESLHSRCPRLCQVAIVGYPAPENNLVGHDLTYLAGLGLLSPPRLPGTLLADLAGAERAAGSALALLYARERGLGAGFSEIALSECAEAFAAPLRYGITAPDGLLGGSRARYRLYQTGQGWIAVAALEEHFWQRLCEKLGFQDVDVSAEELQEIFLARTAVEWETWATSFDLPIAAVR